MKTGPLITLIIIYNISCSSLNGPYFGIEFGHTHFKVTETQTFTDVPVDPSPKIDSSSTRSPSPSSCSSPQLDRSTSTSPIGSDPSHISNQYLSERSESFIPQSSSHGGYSPKELSSNSQSPIPPVILGISPVSDSSSLHSTSVKAPSITNSVSKSPLILNPIPSPKRISTSNSDMSFVDVPHSNPSSSMSFVESLASKPSSSISFVEASSETNDFDFSYHQSASSGDERSSKTKLKQSNKTIPTLIKSLSPINHAQQRNYRTLPRFYPTVFFKTGYGENMGIVYIGVGFKIGHTLSSNQNVILLHRWNFGGDVRIGFYATDDCLIYLKLGLDRDKLVLHKNTDLYLLSFTKGIGIDHLINENVFFSLCLDHSRAIHYSSKVHIVNSKTASIGLRTGMGFKV